jgi:GH24 family phage-related lysozyme (muramidase)
MGLTMNRHSSSNEVKAFVREFEDCRLDAYWDDTSNNWVIGWGQENFLFPGTPGQIPVVKGLTITQQQADDAFEFFMHNVVDPLVWKHFNCDTQAEHDACASWTYNIRMGKLEAGQYTLPTVFNRKPRDFNEIVDWWIKYRNPNTPTEKGLYRRRLAELCLMMNWPHRYAWTATLKRANGQIIEQTDPWHVLEVARHEAEKVAPKTEDQITADLNNAQLEKLGGKVGQTVATPRPPPPAAKPKAAAKEKVAPPAEPVDVTLPPKKIEESKTGKAVNRAERGKETAIIGTITGTGVTAAAANAERVGTLIEKFKPETFMIMAGLVCGFLMVMGIIMWWSGRSEAHYRRQHTQDPKY